MDIEETVIPEENTNLEIPGNQKIIKRRDIPEQTKGRNRGRKRSTGEERRGRQDSGGRKAQSVDMPYPIKKCFKGLKCSFGLICRYFHPEWHMKKFKLWNRVPRWYKEGENDERDDIYKGRKKY